MKSINQKIKHDGYIKNQKIRLRRFYGYISAKTIIVILPMLTMMIALLGIFTINPPPEKWKQKQIVFLSVSEKRTAKRSVYVLNTTDGEYVLGVRANRARALSAQLIPYGEYSIVYCENALTKIVEALYSDGCVYIDLDKSIRERERSLNILYIVEPVMFFTMISGCLLIYTLRCKRERLEIKKIKSRISERSVKIGNTEE